MNVIFLICEQISTITLNRKMYQSVHGLTSAVQTYLHSLYSLFAQQLLRIPVLLSLSTWYH